MSLVVHFRLMGWIRYRATATNERWGRGERGKLPPFTVEEKKWARLILWLKVRVESARVPS